MYQISVVLIQFVLSKHIYALNMLEVTRLRMKRGKIDGLGYLILLGKACCFHMQSSG
jgi:hypothetical protein